MSGDKQKVAPPNYDAWAKKPCWTSRELLFLASGLDPSLYDRLHIHEVDTDSGERREIRDGNAFAIVHGNERLLADNLDLINRLIKAGKLRPIGDDPDYFDPKTAVTTLASSITLPDDLVTAVKKTKAELSRSNHGDAQGDEVSSTTTGQNGKPWLIPDPNDPEPAQPWYTPARYFARQLVKEKPTLLSHSNLLAVETLKLMTNAGVKKRGGKKSFTSDTIKKAFANVKLA